MNIQNIVKERRCVSCGSCYSRCPTGALTMDYMIDIGFFRPSINEDLCLECGECSRGCPSECKSDNIGLLGDYIKIILAHSNNFFVQHEATSGGVINSLVRYLLSNRIIDGALMVRYDSTSKIEASSVLITARNMDELLINTRDYASRYVTVPVLMGLRKLPIYIKRLVVIGTPCQIKALTLGGGVQGNLDIFKIGITCSGGMSYKATEEYKRSQSLKISKMYYRGDGWPGKNCLISSNKTVESDHLGSLFERMFSSQIFKNPGCRNCSDHFAESADISFCDFWDREEISVEKEGNSCVIIRDKRFKEIFSKMQDEGYIEIVRDLDEKEVVNSQSKVLLVKKGDIREKKQYRLFMRLVDYIFIHRIYRYFGIRIYRKFCTYYNRICRNSHI